MGFESSPEIDGQVQFKMNDKIQICIKQKLVSWIGKSNSRCAAGQPENDRAITFLVTAL